MVQLLDLDFDDLAPARRQSFEHGRALGRIDDRGSANDRKSLADRHHDVRVIDRSPPRIPRLERRDFVVRTLCEVRERVDVRPA